MLEGMKFVPLTDQQLSEVRGGMLAVVTGAGKPATLPAIKGTFSTGGLAESMANGAIAGAVLGSKGGNLTGAATTAVEGALATGMGYAATHPGGMPERPSNNIRTFPYMISHPASHPAPSTA